MGLICESIAESKKDNLALKDRLGNKLTYGELACYCRSFKENFKLKERDLVLFLCENTVQSAAFFFGCIHNKVVPLMVNSKIDSQMLERYISLYSPHYVYKNKEAQLFEDWHTAVEHEGYVLLSAKNPNPVELHEQLSLLLPTSGSTGNPKLVRHTYNNLIASATNVAKAFRLNGSERAMLVLPMYFTQGLSVLCSYMYAGAFVYLTDAALSSRDFWDAMKNEEITAFSGVPYSYEILDKLRFYTVKLPHLVSLNQGGGRLSERVWDKLVSFAAESRKRFYATYGSTETTARMSLLAPELAIKKRCSIGKPFEEYEMWLEDESGRKITESNIIGELVFKGANVMMGYAESCPDLSKGDEYGGVYKTGDIAYKDEEGFYYITGRMSRFVKVFGLRINMDEVERMVISEFGDGFICTGSDEQLVICTTHKEADSKAITLFLRDRLQINISAFRVIFLDKILKKPSGKTDYATIKTEIEKELSVS